MMRTTFRAGLLALPVALGGCFVAAPADDYYYGYGRPSAYSPSVVAVYPRVERRYVIEDDTVVVSRPRREYSNRRYVREYRGPMRHRRWYDDDRDRDDD